MKIGKQQSDRNEKLVVYVPEAVAQELGEYKTAYEERYGAPITESKLVGAMLGQLMAEDADFQRWRKTRATRPAPAKSASAPTERAEKPVEPQAVVPAGQGSLLED